MTTIQFINLALLVLAATVGLSYFWSFYTHKLFKPFLWLDEQKKKKIDQIISKQERSSKDKIRFYSLWLQLKSIKEKEINGDLAELGVYKGETAKLIHHMLPDKPLHLFDSFSGLPKQVIREDCDGTVRPQTVQFDNTSPEEVVMFISGNKNISIHEGVFPDTAAGLENKSFAFVHIDADLYQSTIDALTFFYPKMVSGGVIIIHDYNHNWEGVRKAVDEFENTIPEMFIELADMYGSVILRKSSKA